MAHDLLSLPVQHDWEGLRDCILRRGTPDRVYNIELFLDQEVQDLVAASYGLNTGLDLTTLEGRCQRHLRVMRHLGYDYVRVGLDDLPFPMHRATVKDTATLERGGGRAYVNQQRGPITTRMEFETYPWPHVSDATTRALEWYQRNLPDDMCIIAGGGFAHFAEYLVWLPGYETLCTLLYDNRQLLEDIRDRLMAIYSDSLRRILRFDRVKLVWGSDDMGYKNGPLISPRDLRELVLPGHKQMAAMAHGAGLPYLLHSCGDLSTIIDDLIDDVGIDAKHSFEDTIEDVVDVKLNGYGRRIAVLGGMDVDFLCRAGEEAIRDRVRRTLDSCQPGGGYCLGTGNSVANYIPLENYLIMLDEGRRYGR